MVSGDIIEPLPDRFNAAKIVMFLEVIVATFQLG